MGRLSPLNCTQIQMWERACSRRRRHIQYLYKLVHRFREQTRSHRLCVHSVIPMRTHMKNDDLRADRDDLDDLDHFIPRAPTKRGNNLVMQVAAGVFLGGLALWLVQLGATALYAKLMVATITFGG